MKISTHSKQSLHVRLAAMTCSSVLTIVSGTSSFDFKTALAMRGISESWTLYAKGLPFSADLALPWGVSGQQLFLIGGTMSLTTS